MLDERVHTLLDYHERTKHRLERYAAGPETLDWDAQPDPFRRFAGSPLEPLPLVADELRRSWADLHAGLIEPQVFSRQSLAALLELSFGLSAWKQYGPDRWALRCNPSSGNLHPTEAYVLAHDVAGLDDGLYHYAPREHALELRATLNPGLPRARPHLWIALSSVLWRESWKYGERAFRYCQLDTGHALGAVRYAAALLGWRARLVPCRSDTLASLLGLGRDVDFNDAETEDAEMLIEIFPEGANLIVPQDWTLQGQWHGRANRLDRGPRFYKWPIIDLVAEASRHTHPSMPTRPPRLVVDELPRSEVPAATLIRQRRSAQHFDRRAHMPAADFLAIVRALLNDHLPWDAWPDEPRLHPIIFVHRVDGIPGGAWALPRSRRGEQLLRAALSHDMQWQALDGISDELPFYQLANNAALAGTLRTLCCHQAIASDACFAVAMLAEFSDALHEDPANYRALYQEAGLLGQVLYMEAEAHGFRGTGIGCYFDDATHELLGITDRRLQSLYHFTVGMPLTDERISTEPPYADHYNNTEPPT